MKKVDYTRGLLSLWVISAVCHNPLLRVPQQHAAQKSMCAGSLSHWLPKGRGFTATLKTDTPITLSISQQRTVLKWPPNLNGGTAVSIIQALKHGRDPTPRSLRSQIPEVQGNHRKLQAQEEPPFTHCKWSYTSPHASPLFNVVDSSHEKQLKLQFKVKRKLILVSGSTSSLLARAQDGCRVRGLLAHDHAFSSMSSKEGMGTKVTWPVSRRVRSPSSSTSWRFPQSDRIWTHTGSLKHQGWNTFSNSISLLDPHPQPHSLRVVIKKMFYCLLREKTSLAPEIFFCLGLTHFP